MHNTMTHEQVMELAEGNMVRVEVFYPNEPVMQRIAFVDSQESGIVHYHLWDGTPGVATHGGLYAALEAA